MNEKQWEPENFELEMNTVWSFPNRGNWATHDAAIGIQVVDICV